MRSPLAGLSLGFLAATCSFAQLVISAHSGVVQYVEGQAYLNQQPIELQFGHYPDIKQDQEFRTEAGRAEILLTPGVFLRLGENSAIRMLSNGLTDTRVEVLRGSAIAECDQIPKDNSIMLVYKDSSITLAKHGLYRVDTEPARLQVYDGEAVVTGGAGQLTLKGGKQTDLGATLLAQSFDKSATDELYRWANRRASYVAQANVASASSFNGGGYGYGYSSSAFLGGWSWNPVFGMFTVVPLGGMFYSPFGYPFWSPYTVFNAPSYSGYSGVNFRGPSPLAAMRAGRMATRPSFGSVRSGGTAATGARAGGLGHAGGGGHMGGGHAGGGGHGR